MAQMDGMRFIGNPTVDQLLAGGDETQKQYCGAEPMSMTPTLSRNDDQEEDHSTQHVKKSVLEKVKDKAKKWRHALAKKKKQGQDGGNSTPSWGVSLEDDEDEEEAPEYHGAPMYESELAPSSYNQQTRTHQQPSTISPTTPEHSLESKVICEVDDSNKKKSKVISEAGHDSNKKKNNGNKSITETVTDMLAPAYIMVSDAKHMITSKVQLGPGDEATCKNKWDRGLSVKEYLKQKLEPGEDERALSQVISQAMSPTSGDNGEMGVVEKVKEAVSSLLGAEEPSSSIPNSSNACGRDNGEVGVVEKVKEAFSSLLGVEEPSSSSIPISSNAREEIIEETSGRRLQTN